MIAGSFEVKLIFRLTKLIKSFFLIESEISTTRLRIFARYYHVDFYLASYQIEFVGQSGMNGFDMLRGLQKLDKVTIMT